MFEFVGPVKTSVATFFMQKIYFLILISAMVAPELKHNADNTEITKTCAVLACDDSKNLSSDEFFGYTTFGFLSFLNSSL